MSQVIDRWEYLDGSSMEANIARLFHSQSLTLDQQMFLGVNMGNGDSFMQVARMADEWVKPYKPWAKLPFSFKSFYPSIYSAGNHLSAYHLLGSRTPVGYKTSAVIASMWLVLIKKKNMR